MKLPELSEGWSWHISRTVIPCTNPKCCAEGAEGHRKVRVELLLHGQVREHGLIDVEFYGDTQSVSSLAQSMLDWTAAKQRAGLT